MYDRLGSVRKRFQDVEQAAGPVEGYIANSLTVLIAPADLDPIPLRVSKIQIFIDVDRGIRLGLPGFPLTCSYPGEVCRVVQDQFGVEARRLECEQNLQNRNPAAGLPTNSI